MNVLEYGAAAYVLVKGLIATLSDVVDLGDFASERLGSDMQSKIQGPSDARSPFFVLQVYGEHSMLNFERS